MNNEIAAASSEQTTGIQQISKAMNQLDQSSQSNAASAEEIAATSGEINNLATTTQGLTVELNEVIYGTSDVVPAPEAKQSAARKSTSSAQKKVLQLKKPTPRAPVKTAHANTASDLIPFDEDSDRKVGTVDGF